MKLEKIESKIVAIEGRLANLQPREDLEDVSNVATERAALREELQLLQEAEQRERIRLAEADRDAREKARVTALKTVAGNAETLQRKHQQLTEKATALIGDLVETLVERESLATSETVGLDTPEAHAYLTKTDRSDLTAALRNSVPRLYPASFAATWAAAVESQPKKFGPALRALAPSLGGPGPAVEHPPLKPANDQLALVASELARHPTLEPENHTPRVAPEQSQVKGAHQTVDIRPRTAAVQSVDRHAALNSGGGDNAA